jgi:hypothetical protein
LPPEIEKLQFVVSVTSYARLPDDGSVRACDEPLAATVVTGTAAADVLRMLLVN